MASAKVFGAKLSPYIVTPTKPVITAWTALMSMETGQPLMWCDAGLLTIERTAGATALAVEHLAAPDAGKLAIIGSGAVGQAHLRRLASVRPWRSIQAFFARSQGQRGEARGEFAALDERVVVSNTIEDCVREADVVALCTSSGTPVLHEGMLGKPALVTSISTNAANAHEIRPCMDSHHGRLLRLPANHAGQRGRNEVGRGAARLVGRQRRGRLARTRIGRRAKAVLSQTRVFSLDRTWAGRPGHRVRTLQVFDAAGCVTLR